MSLGRLLVLAIACAGCAQLNVVTGLVTGRAPACPGKGGPLWIEVSTQHFRLASDLPTDQVRALGVEFERIYQAFLDLSFFDPAARSVPQSRLEVVVFASRTEFFARTDITNEHTEAMFRWGSAFRPSYMLMYGELTREAREVFQHELTHHFAHQYLPSAPVWLQEGLAEYYETLRFADGGVRLGEPLRCVGFFGIDRASHLEDTARCSGSGYLSVTDVPRIADLLAMDYEAFHKLQGEGTDKYKNQEANYAGAWALVHMMWNTTPERRAAFRRYLNDLAAGIGPDQAWRKEIGAPDSPTLDDDVRAHLLRSEDAVWKVDYQPHDDAMPRVRALRDSEVHLLWAGVHGHGPSARLAGDAEIGEALREDPDAAEAQFAFGRSEQRNGRPKTARHALRQAVEMDGKNERYRLALLMALNRTEGAKASQPASEEEIEAAFHSLARIAHSAETLCAIAEWFSDRNEAERAMPFVLRGLEREPGNADCLTNAGMIAALKGDYEGALDFTRRALNLLPDGENPAPVRALLTVYRSRLKQGKGKDKGQP